MALSDINELRESIAAHLERDDLYGRIDEFIRLAEARHRRDIRIREMLDRQSLTVNDQYVAIPTGFLEAESLRLLTDPYTVLVEVTPYEMARLHRSGTGKPKYFTIQEEIEFDIDTDQSYSGEIVFYKALTPLSDSNTSNALLTRAPDAYLYGALLASAPFVYDDPRLETWGALYNAAREALDYRKDRKVGPQFARVAGSTP